MEIAVDKEWETWKLGKWKVALPAVVRVTADEGSDYVGKLSEGAELTGLEQVEAAKGFLRIRFEDCCGMSGWVSVRGADGTPLLQKVEKDVVRFCPPFSTSIYCGILY